MSDVRSRSYFLGLLPLPERQAVARALRTETVGGLMLLVAAVVALGFFVGMCRPWKDTGAAAKDEAPAKGLSELSARATPEVGEDS